MVEKQDNLSLSSSRSPENEPTPLNKLLPEITITESQLNKYFLLSILPEKSPKKIEGLKISSKRAYHALKSSHIDSVGDLLILTREEFLRMRNIGILGAVQIAADLQDLLHLDQRYSEDFVVRLVVETASQTRSYVNQKHISLALERFNQRRR